MTTFAVFGMSSTRAVELAREEVPNEVQRALDAEREGHHGGF